jgi:hypothetical protein
VKFIPPGEKVSPAVSELIGSAEVFIPLDNPAEIERLKGHWRKQLEKEAPSQIIKPRKAPAEIVNEAAQTLKIFAG